MGIAVFNSRTNILKVFEVHNVGCGAVGLVIDLNHLFVKNPGKLFMANFLMGKVMLILESESETEDENKLKLIEGNCFRKQSQHAAVRNVIFSTEGIVTMSDRLQFYHQE